MSSPDTVKVVLLGEAGVGKTCIITKFITGNYNPDTISSLSAQFISKTLEFKDINRTIKFDIWDTAGQERFRALAKIFYKDAKVICLCYDISNKKSFEELKNFWYSYVTSAVGKEIIFGIAGNKSDLYENEQVKVSDAQQFANEIGAVFKETTAKNYEAITSLIEEMSSKYIQQSSNENKNENENEKIVIGKSKSKNKDRCCNRRRA